MLALCLVFLVICESFVLRPAPLHYGRSCNTRLAARRGAMSRRKQKSPRGFAKRDVAPPPSASGEIYSLPALYDLASGYRDFEEEAKFLLKLHKTHSKTFSTDTEGLHVLDLGAGPARHAIEALKLESNPVKTVTAIDIAPEMVKYGNEVADAELPNERDRASFEYVESDMTKFELQHEPFDSTWILLGSLQHLITNEQVVSCFRAAHRALRVGGTLIVELPHPKETFCMVDCTRNSWEVPLEDDRGKPYGKLQVIWGDEGDDFDPISQVRNFTVSMFIKAAKENQANHQSIHDPLQSVKDMVPMRQFTSQEIDALARCSGFEVAATYGALEEDAGVNDNDAYRLVSVLRKKDFQM